MKISRVRVTQFEDGNGNPLVFCPKNIKLLMIEKDIDILVLAEKLGTARSNVYNILIGHTTPKVGRLEKLAKILGVEVESFFEGGLKLIYTPKAS